MNLLYNFEPADRYYPTFCNAFALCVMQRGLLKKLTIPFLTILYLNHHFAMHFAQFIPIIITALLGIVGLIAKTKKDDKPGYFNRLTPFGVIVLLLLTVSSVTTYELQRQKEEQNYIERAAANNRYYRDSMINRQKFIEDSISHKATIDSLGVEKRNNLGRFNITLLKFSQQLNYQNRALFEIQRVLHPLKNFQLSFQIEVHSGKSIPLQLYFSNLKKIVDSLLPSLVKSHRPIEGLNIIGGQDSIGRKISVSSTSKYSLNNEGVLEAYGLFWPTINVAFIKEPSISKNKNNTRHSDDTKNINMELQFRQKDGEADIIYDRFENKLIVSGYQLLPDSAESGNDGTITSMLDLSKASVSFRFDDINHLIDIKLHSLRLDMSGSLTLDVDPNKVKEYKKDNELNYLYSYFNFKNALLSFWR
jgi:hypothetical protein